VTAERVLERFTAWLHLPDPGVVLATLGTLAANRLDGDAVWLLIVGPPSGGKSEVIGSAASLDFTYSASTITEAALLSATPKKEKAKEARGGLLREVGEFGVIAVKDFGSILSMNRDARHATLMALREIYDGSWTRRVGSEGGRELTWRGKVGLIAACTPTIDRHHAVMGAMGERFVLYRLVAEDDEQAVRALTYAGREAEMRAELREAVRDLIAGALAKPRELDDAERARLIALAMLAVRGRSAVERDGYSREIELVPEPEGPARLVKILDRLLAGLDALGVEREVAWYVVTKAALDCIPAIRCRLIDMLACGSEPTTTKALAEGLGYPTNTIRRAVEDLTVHGLAKRIDQGDGRADLWELTGWTRQQLGVGVPEVSGPLYYVSTYRERLFGYASANGAGPLPARRRERAASVDEKKAGS
jgi:hypothetical protein